MAFTREHRVFMSYSIDFDSEWDSLVAVKRNGGGSQQDIAADICGFDMKVLVGTEIAAMISCVGWAKKSCLYVNNNESDNLSTVFHVRSRSREQVLHVYGSKEDRIT